MIFEKLLDKLFTELVFSIRKFIMKNRQILGDKLVEKMEKNLRRSVENYLREKDLKKKVSIAVGVAMWAFQYIGQYAAVMAGPRGYVIQKISSNIDVESAENVLSNVVKLMSIHQAYVTAQIQTQSPA